MARTVAMHGKPRHLLDMSRSIALHANSDEQAARLVSRLGSMTREQFEQARAAGIGAMPVIIPVFNEARDLPATLASLARSRQPVLPIVVDNNSTDRTAERAEAMGADVLFQPTGRKMAATQRGVSEAVRRGHSAMLFTDGDSLMLPRGPEAMSARLRQVGGPAGAAVFGSSYALFGKSLATDLLSSVFGARESWRIERDGRLPIAKGHNYALQLDRRGRMLDALMRFDPEIFAGPGHPVPDDVAIRDAMVDLGIPVVGAPSPDAYVITTNDRVSSLSDWWRLRQRTATWEEVAAPSYLAEYGMGPHSPVSPAQSVITQQAA
jgi:hypothetical protein